jgi:hypothetical protein
VLEMKGDDNEEPDLYTIHAPNDSDSHDEAIVMTMANSKWKSPLVSRMRATSQASFSDDNKDDCHATMSNAKVWRIQPGIARDSSVARQRLRKQATFR